MGNFRIDGGWAWGKENNFFARTDGLIAESDTTPDVTSGNFFFTNNTSNTVITSLDLTSVSNAGNNAGKFEGKVVTIMFLDSSTGLANAAPFVLSTSSSLAGANNMIQLVYHNSSWIELTRSVNVSNIVTAQSSGLGTTGIINVQGRRLAVITAATGSAATVRRAINGEEGQELTLLAMGSSVLVTVNSAANDTFILSSSAGATTLTMSASSSIQFIRFQNKWFETRANAANGISI